MIKKEASNRPGWGYFSLEKEWLGRLPFEWFSIFYLYLSQINTSQISWHEKNNPFRICAYRFDGGSGLW